MSIPKFQFKLFAAEIYGKGLLRFFVLIMVLFQGGIGIWAVGLLSLDTVDRILTTFYLGAGQAVWLNVRKVGGQNMNGAITNALWFPGKLDNRTIINIYPIKSAGWGYRDCLTRKFSSTRKFSELLMTSLNLQLLSAVVLRLITVCI